MKYNIYKFLPVFLGVSIITSSATSSVVTYANTQMQMGGQMQMGQMSQMGEMPMMGEMPDMSQMGEMPMMEEMPDMSQMGEMPDMSQMGEMPMMGERPEIQEGELQMGEVPTMWQMPEMSEIPQQEQAQPVVQEDFSSYVQSVEVAPTNSTIYVNGTLVEVDAYKINDNNFIKLRDLAYMLNNTNKNFEVTWNNEAQSIEMLSNNTYTVVGGEMVQSDGSAKTATLNQSQIYVDGKAVTLVAYKIDDNNFFKLRDIMQIFDVAVGWEASTDAVTLDTNSSYETTETTTQVPVMPEGQMGQMGEMQEGEMGQMMGQMGQMPEGQMGQMGERPEGQMGQMPSGGMPQMESTYTVEEAKAIEQRLVEDVGYKAWPGGYPIVDTNQTIFYSNDAIISEPAQGEAFYGQDASHSGNQQNYTNNGDGTITDNITGLMWQQDPGEKMTWAEAVDNLDAFNEQALGGYSDWRIPTMKELYSLVDFSGNTGMSSSASTPYINTDYFKFTYGDEAGEARFIDSQILSSTIYGSTTLGNNTTVFGFNFADGRIKGYEIDKDFYCYYVRGNTSYGQNVFVDNEDDTIADLATGLMWMQNDSGYYNAGDNGDGTMDWESALAWAEQMNEENFLGYSDWRVPNVKELQSLTDYSNSPIVTGKPAIDEIFNCTEIVNYFGERDWGFYWSSTTHDDLSASETRYGAASYVVFGNSLGEMNGNTLDVHGSGAQRSDPKTGSRDEYPAPDPNAPQGDEQRVFNMVRLVRDAQFMIMGQ